MDLCIISMEQKKILNLIKENHQLLEARNGLIFILKKFKKENNLLWNILKKSHLKNLILILIMIFLILMNIVNLDVIVSIIVFQNNQNIN